MRLPRAAALLALLLAVPASADKAIVVPEGRDMSAPATFPLTGCDQAQQARVEAAIRAAREKVDACLEGINPKMAAEIRRQFKKFDFACDQEPRGAGGDTKHEVDGDGRLVAAHIKLTMHSRLIQYSMAARAFHEMIHAIDPPAGSQAKANRDGRFIISAQRHATAGFPDPVYGCQFACYGEIGEDEGKVMNRYLRTLSEGGLDIPETTKDVKCPEGSGPDCPLYIKRYARLCETGKPVVTGDLVERDRKANRPTCIAENLANACDAADDASCASAHPPKGRLCGLRCEFINGAAANGGRVPRAVADRLFSIGAALASAVDDGVKLEGENAEFYAEAKKKGLIQACR